MENFIFFDKETRDKFIRRRAGETKFGERLSSISSFEDLQKSKAQYVIFGIPEDIGIRANYGKPGAHTAWKSFLRSFLNLQVCTYNQPENCIVLGHVDCEQWMRQAAKIISNTKNTQEELGAIVNEIDKKVSAIVRNISSLGKTPIIIGGGHNNSYGNIKGSSEALKKPVNILNIDAHTDLRRTDYRHSGNGFSYAKERGFMNKYAMLGLHKNYTPQYIFEQYKRDPKVRFDMFEDITHSPEENLIHVLENAIDFLENQFGLEIDCDSIANFPASAMTPSGFSIREIRRFINRAQKADIHYLHLAEAAAKEDGQVGKALSYFVSDFIRKTEKNKNEI